MVGTKQDRSATPRRIPPFWSRSKHGGNPPGRPRLPQCVLLRDYAPLAPRTREAPGCDDPSGPFHEDQNIAPRIDVCRLPDSNGIVMGTLPSSAEKVLTPHRGTMSPLCAQCRKSMVLVICEPDFHDSMVATYRCQECGLMDRAEVVLLRASVGAFKAPSRQVCSQPPDRTHALR